MSGKDYLVYISDDGTSLGTKTEVEFQGDLRVNDGRTVERTNYKNGSKTSQGTDGFSANFEMALDEPLPTGIAAVLAASDNDSDTYAWIEPTATGGRRWEGPVKFIVTEFSMPTSGQPSCTVEVSENGDMTVGTVT